jgi:cellulose synthase/poly-beta-1,6-N-acetylglucosamine synthase-like glycosyltransferase
VKKNKNRKHSVRRIIEIITILMISLVLIGKVIFYNSNPNEPIFYYGISVTFVLLIVFIFSFFVYKDPYLVAIEKDGPDHTKNYLVSCMVAVKNEEQHINRCLDSLLAQTYLNKEIIVVNDASTDGTLEILREYEQKGMIILINLETNVGKKRALGKAMSIARGEVFAFTDSDSVWAPYAISRIVKIFEFDPDVGAVSGHSRVYNVEMSLFTKIQDPWYECQYSIRKAFESIFGCVTCVSGPIAVFRREAVFNYVPAWENDRFLGQEFKFATDRTLTGFVLGSVAIGNKLKTKYKDSPFVNSIDYPVKDWKIVYCKSARAWTIVPDTFSKIIKQQVRWKKSFIRNLFFTGAFYWKKPFLPALFYYLHIVFVILGPFICFRHLIYLPLQGNPFSAVIYLAGILFVGLMFGIAFKLEDPSSPNWIFRPLMSLISTLFLSWLIIYSLVSIRKMVWSRD